MPYVRKSLILRISPAVQAVVNHSEGGAFIQ